MQGDRQTLEDPRWSRSVIPLAHCVRPSPLKGGLTLWQTFEDPCSWRSVIPLAHFVQGGLTLWQTTTGTIQGSLLLRSPFEGGRQRSGATMQGDRQTREDPRLSRSVIPLAHCVRPSPLKGGLTLWQTFEDPPL